MIDTTIVGFWFKQTDTQADETFLVIRCEKCRNPMRARPGKTVTCGRDWQTYTAPPTLHGLREIVAMKDRNKARAQRQFSRNFRAWQQEQNFDLTERKWRERMSAMAKEGSTQ